ncbi:hypothetical protein TNCV_1618021 [Trichonephila clavipes]|nr:hypothetical protein TNCV_1618021 [Trichonephila clavipes]
MSSTKKNALLDDLKAFDVSIIKYKMVKILDLTFIREICDYEDKNDEWKSFFKRKGQTTKDFPRGFVTEKVVDRIVTEQQQQNEDSKFTTSGPNVRNYPDGYLLLELTDCFKDCKPCMFWMERSRKGQRSLLIRAQMCSIRKRCGDRGDHEGVEVAENKQ